MQLTHDPAIYPREAVNERHIRELIDALHAGETLPPITALPDGRILDGVHRYYAHQQVGKEPDVQVVEEDQALLRAAALNSRHGLKMTAAEKKTIACRYWEPVEGIVEEIAAALSVTVQTVREWTREVRDDDKRQRKEKAIRLADEGWTQEQIAEEVGVTQMTVSRWLEEYRLNKTREAAECLSSTLRPYTVWNFSSCSPLFGCEHPGRLPGELVANVIHWFTEEGELVVDPMAGGGTTHDVAEAMGRRCECFDLTPVREFIHEHDITTGLPEITAEADLVFLDPPYATMKAGNYSESATDLANMDVEVFIGLVQALALDLYGAMKAGAKVAFIIMDLTGKDLIDGRPVWLGLKSCSAFLDAGFRPVALIDAPLSQDSLQPQQIERAKEQKQLLGLSRWLFVVEKV